MDHNEDPLDPFMLQGTLSISGSSRSFQTSKFYITCDELEVDAPSSAFSQQSNDTVTSGDKKKETLSIVDAFREDLTKGARTGYGMACRATGHRFEGKSGPMSVLSLFLNCLHASVTEVPSVGTGSLLGPQADGGPELFRKLILDLSLVFKDSPASLLELYVFDSPLHDILYDGGILRFSNLVSLANLGDLTIIDVDTRHRIRLSDFEFRSIFVTGRHALRELRLNTNAGWGALRGTDLPSADTLYRLLELTPNLECLHMAINGATIPSLQERGSYLGHRLREFNLLDSFGGDAKETVSSLLLLKALAPNATIEAWNGRLSEPCYHMDWWQALIVGKPLQVTVGHAVRAPWYYFWR